MDTQEKIKLLNLFLDALNKEENLNACLLGVEISIRDLISSGDTGNLKDLSSSNIPGTRNFLDGEFREFPEIENSYAELRVNLSGGLSDSARDVIEVIKGFK